MTVNTLIAAEDVVILEYLDAVLLDVIMTVLFLRRTISITRIVAKSVVGTPNDRFQVLVNLVYSDGESLMMLFHLHSKYYRESGVAIVQYLRT